jgi:hypothetical protein
MGGRTHAQDEERSGRPSAVGDDLVQTVDQKIVEELSYEFSQISRTGLYEIIAIRLHYHKFCTEWVPKLLTWYTRNVEKGFDFDFLEQYHNDGDEFLSHILRCDETWASFMNVESKEQ